MIHTKNKIIFWRNHMDWFIPFISEFYPLTKFQLLRYEDFLDWGRIKANRYIRWEWDMIKAFQEKLDTAERLPDRGMDVVITDHEIDVTINHNYPDAEHVYFRPNERTSNDQMYWKDIIFGLYKKREYNEEAVMHLIDTFHCGIKIDRDPFSSLPLPSGFLESYLEDDDWDLITEYWGLMWSFELLQRFEGNWVTEKLILNHTAFNYCLKDDLDDEFIENVLG